MNNTNETNSTPPPMKNPGDGASITPPGSSLFPFGVTPGSVEAHRVECATVLVACVERTTQMVRRMRDLGDDAATSSCPWALDHATEQAVVAVEHMRRLGQLLRQYEGLFGTGAVLSLVNSLEALTLADALYCMAMARRVEPAVVGVAGGAA